ncbi:saccharopine dehydrogenase [Irpex lacteus]|nr:saccharopine dehydrogenase [Irpex lacteus]
MAPLTHPSIREGWFREISPQWPGQALTLKVERILHTEKSPYQDLLVFRSTHYGTVLVLDGVIQATERDEFSYQEMIAHIPLSTHPSPSRVLVIGGGDGGVVREVLRHATVEHVTLVDIDEAVVRVSKTYLPHMSRALEDPRVTVHIGDGFKFLADAAAAGSSSLYDVIITDSSDPVGPASSLFQPPYFQLLHNALAPGGTISTQGECQWLHTPLIRELLTSTRQIFKQAKYAYTTIPTYPSGQIGFIVASKASAEERDLTKPLRKIEGTKYWNEQIHGAAFVLPEFVRLELEEGRDVKPAFSEVPAHAFQKTTASGEKAVLLLGSGFVAKPAAEYILRDKQNKLIVACRTLTTASSFVQTLSPSTLTSSPTTPRASAISLDVASPGALEKVLTDHNVDLVVSLIPYTHHADVIKAAISTPVHVVTTSYINPQMRALAPSATAANVIVLNEVGLDPGIDHLYAVKCVGDVHARGGKIKEFHSYCGGLPSPESSSNPLGYKFSWSSRGVLLALLNSASYISSSRVVSVPGQQLMSHAQPYYISPAFNFIAYPNRDSTPYREWYKIDGEGEGETVVRGTLRYKGFETFVGCLVGLGWLDGSGREWLGKAKEEEWSWARVFKEVLGAKGESESELTEAILAKHTFPSPAEQSRILSGLKWLGLFSADTPATIRGTPELNLLDTLCARLEVLMKYEEGERDLVMLQHKFVVEWKDGSRDTITSTLEAYGVPYGDSAMATTVGLPCGIATQLVLDGVINTPGVLAPYTKEICDPIREVLESEGWGLVERVL